MNVLFFTENYYRGGLDTFLINLFNAWPDAGDELTLACNATHPGLATIEAKVSRPLKVERYSRIFTSNIAQGQSSLSGSRIFLVRAFFVLAFRILQYPVLFPWYVFALTMYFWRSDFDRLMVVNGGYPASLLCRCAVIAWRLAGKRPLAVMNFHNSTTGAPWCSRIFENAIDALVIRSVTDIVSVSKNCLDSLSSRPAFLGCGKLSYIFNGIEDPSRAPKVALVGDKNGSVASRYCLMLGTYEPRKGHAYLLRAFQSVVETFPDVRLLVHGHARPHEYERVANEVRRFKLESSVTLGDFTPDTSFLLAGASVLVVPSQTEESFGLTIIEAMAFGVPVVITDVGGMPEVLGDSDAGYVCSKHKPLEFAVAIKRILGDRALAFSLGRNGQLAFMRRFAASTMASNYMKLLK